MVGCFIGLFVKQKLIPRIKDLMTTKIKTGLGGSAGNKGSVIVRFKLDDTSIMFMNCHLMSGKGKGSKRTEEISLIMDNVFKNESKTKRVSVADHNMVFLFGDLNFRIQNTNEVVRKAVQFKDINSLKEYDELNSFLKQFKNSRSFALLLQRV